MKNFKQYLEETGSVGVWNQTPVDVDGYDKDGYDGYGYNRKGYDKDCK